MVDNRAARTAEQKPTLKSKRSWSPKVMIAGVFIVIVALLVLGT